MYMVSYRSYRIRLLHILNLTALTADKPTISAAQGTVKESNIALNQCALQCFVYIVP